MQPWNRIVAIDQVRNRRSYLFLSGSQNAFARFAGLIYFFTIFDDAGVVIVSRISGTGSFLDSAHRIAGSETLFRVGILFGLIGTMSTVLLAAALYVTLKQVDVNLAMTALLFRLVEALPDTFQVWNPLFVGTEANSVS